MSRVVPWLRKICSSYDLAPYAIYRKHSPTEIRWPLTVASELELREVLRDAGKFEPLPKEPATLGNIIEVSLARFLSDKIAADHTAVTFNLGTERGYPDIEVFYEGQHHAIDIKVARRNKNLKQTQSRITLYTGNTFFKYPELHWPSTLRPFSSYASHVNLIVIYTLDVDSLERVRDLELIVQEAWQVGSRERSSTTREYIGAVMSLANLREGKGEFASQEEFYKYWRKFPFNIPKSVAHQLTKLLSAQAIAPKTADEAKPPKV